MSVFRHRIEGQFAILGTHGNNGDFAAKLDEFLDDQTRMTNGFPGLCCVFR